jgi:hypothetical protein
MLLYKVARINLLLELPPGPDPPVAALVPLSPREKTPHQYCIASRTRDICLPQPLTQQLGVLQTTRQRRCLPTQPWVLQGYMRVADCSCMVQRDLCRPAIDLPVLLHRAAYWSCLAPLPSIAVWYQGPSLC